MSVKQKYSVSIDLDAPVRPVDIKAKQRTDFDVEITVTRSGAAVDLTGVTPSITYGPADGSYAISVTGAVTDASGGVCLISPTTTDTDYTGSLQADFILADADDLSIHKFGQLILHGRAADDTAGTVPTGTNLDWSQYATHTGVDPYGPYTEGVGIAFGTATAEGRIPITLTGGAGGNIEDSTTAETITTKVLKPDGAGGVSWEDETGGGVFQLEWRFTSSTAASDPGTGKLGFDSATPASVTSWHINETGNGGQDLAAYLQKLTVGDLMRVQQEDDAAKYMLCSVASAPTDNTGWWTVAVTVEDSGTLPSNNKAMDVLFSYIGSGSGGAVDSVFGRTGVVEAAASDYDAVQIDYDPSSDPFTSATEVQTALQQHGNGIAGNYDFVIANQQSINNHKADLANPHQVKASQVPNDSGVADGTNVSDALASLYYDAKGALVSTSTGWASGCGFSINADSTKFDIAAGTVFFSDYTGAYPYEHSLVQFAGATAITPAGLLTNPVTYISIDSAGAVVQDTDFPTPSSRRDAAFIGVVVHSSNTVVELFNELPDVALDGNAQLHDLMNAIGFFSVSGNVIGAAGTNLEILKSAGVGFKGGVNAQTDITNPHQIVLPELDPITFRYRLKDGTEFADVTDIDASIWDDGTSTPATVPQGNDATIQRVFVFPSNVIRVQPGQEVFGTLSQALDEAGIEQFQSEANIEANGLYLGSIVVRKDATNLSNTAQARFIIASGISGGQGFQGTLQEAYDVSSNPEVVTDSLRGALTFQGGTGDDADLNLEIKNNAGATTMSVAASGATIVPEPTIDGHAATKKYVDDNSNPKELILPASSFVGPLATGASDDCGYVSSDLAVFAESGIGVTTSNATQQSRDYIITVTPPSGWTSWATTDCLEFRCWAGSNSSANCEVSFLVEDGTNTYLSELLNTFATADTPQTFAFDAADLTTGTLPSGPFQIRVTLWTANSFETIFSQVIVRGA